MIGYRGAHHRVARARGRASDHLCSCGAQARDWAYDGQDPAELSELRARQVSPSPYSLDPAHYVPLCGPCHYEVDRPVKTYCKRGHEMSPENTKIKNGTSRTRATSKTCRACENDKQNAAYAARKRTP